MHSVGNVLTRSPGAALQSMRRGVLQPVHRQNRSPRSTAMLPSSLHVVLICLLSQRGGAVDLFRWSGNVDSSEEKIDWSRREAWLCCHCDVSSTFKLPQRRPWTAPSVSPSASTSTQISSSPLSSSAAATTTSHTAHGPRATAVAAVSAPVMGAAASAQAGADAVAAEHIQLTAWRQQNGVTLVINLVMFSAAAEMVTTTSFLAMFLAWCCCSPCFRHSLTPLP